MSFYHIEDRSGAVDYEDDTQPDSKQVLADILTLAKNDSDMIFIAWGTCPWRFRDAFRGFILMVCGNKCVLESYHDKQSYQIKPGMLKNYFH